MRSAAANIAMVFVLATAGAAPGHGVRHSTSEGGTIVRAAYDDGSPMAFCDVAVLAPCEAETPFQAGATDRNGGFAFIPDTNGTWTVTVDDGMGHRVTARVVVEQGALVEGNAAVPAGRLHGAIVGLGILFGLFGLWALFANRHKASVPTPSA